MRLLTCFAFAITVWAGAAFSEDCTPRFAASSQTVSINDVDIGARRVSRESFKVRVVNQDNGSCSAYIRASRIDGTAVSSNLQYIVRSGSNVLDLLPNRAAASTSNSDLFVGGIPNGDSGRAVPFLLSVPSDWGMASGFHSEQVQFELLDAAGQVVDTLLLTININVPSAVSMRIVGARGAGGVASIDLGTITSRDMSVSNPFGVRVWSTSPYRVSFESENKGNLRHEGGLDLIAYELQMDNQRVNLGTAGSFVFPQRTGPLGNIHKLRVRASPAAGRAGNYSDRVTVTVTAV